jgi:subtilisin family serine protease
MPLHRIMPSLVAPLALSVLAALAACHDQSPVSHDPTHLAAVSGAKQSGDPSAALTQPLVVEALDGANRAVAGVPITWTVTGGGSVSAPTSTTGADGKATVTWTLAPTAGVQVATATSAKVGGASASFVADNGATISGTVTGALGNPFSATFARGAANAARLGRSANLAGAAQTVTRHPSADRIIVGFKNAPLGLAAAGTGTYRSLSVARSARSQLAARVTALQSTLPVSHAELSPALLAARLRVDDRTRVEAVMASLRADPNVAWVERDAIVSVRDGAPPPMSTSFVDNLGGVGASPASAASSAAIGKLPNDPFFWQQTWSANMLDLPRAWTITTGSASVIVASVDMGVRFDHPEVAANLTSDGYDFVSQAAFDTTQTICGSGSFTTIDGDGDGPDADPTDPDDLEFTSSGCWVHNRLGDHGLWTAGIIGAAGNDAHGLAGVNWAVKIRPIRVLGITGDGTDFDIAQGILYAAGLPAPGKDSVLVQAPSAAQIINMSLGGPFPSSVMSAAVAAAVNAGVLVVASAGNDGLDFPSFPAAYPGVMAVAAVGMDGALATYSNAGTFLSVAAPGGDFRLDDNGGGGVLGPGWDFEANVPTFLFGYGTSASAPFVSGIAALLLAQTPGLTAAQLRSRIEQYATRPAGTSRSDSFGWGIVNAYNALTQQNGPARKTFARLVNATTGAAVRTVPVDANGGFLFARLDTGAYFVQAGDDESGDNLIGVPGRRFTWAGGFAKPTVFNVNGDSHAIAIALGIPAESEPNDDNTHANLLSVGSYVVGSITPPDTRDVYAVTIPTAGQYTFETSGLVGSCGLGIELDTFLQVASASGTSVGTSDNFASATSRFCSRVQATLTPGIYYVTVTGTGAAGLSPVGRYRLEVRSGG